MPHRKRASSPEPVALEGASAAILDALPANVALLAADGAILAVNRTWRDFAHDNGYALSGAGVGVNYLWLCDAVDGPEAHDARHAAEGIRAVLAGTLPEFAFEYPCHSPTELRWFRMRATALGAATEGHRQDGAVVMHLNMTEERLADDSRRMQAQMLDQIGQAVLATDLAGNIIYANRFASTLYRWPPDEILGRLITEVTVPQASHEQADCIMKQLQRGETWTGEFLVQDRTGRVFPASVVDSPLLDERGKPIGILGISSDISERREAAAALLASDRRHRQLAAELAEERARLVAAQAVAKVGSWETDLDTMIVEWSDETHRIFGTDPATGPMTHRQFLDRVHPEDRDRVEKAFNSVLGDEGPGTVQHQIVLPNGQVKTVEENWHIFRDETGTPRRALGTCQDITERKRLEQQFLRSQRMESVGTLAGGIAHDLNNVLAPILMATELLDSQVKTDEGRELLTTLRESAERGASLVKQVLSFARGVQGERAAVNPLTLTRELVKVMRETFPKSITVETASAAGLWTLTGDATQVHQVLMNLCVNARDAMPNGGSIVVSLDNVVIDETYAAMTPEAAAGSYVLMRVSDTGTGIPPEVRDRIFEPFFTTKEVGKGTGLGLSTTRAIVKSHGGFLTVESTVGVGTTFSVYLPANVARIAADSDAESPVPPRRGNGELLLVVDDEPAIRHLLERLLVAAGYQVISAANGAEGISQYVEHAERIAAVLTDMAMPIMDGPTMIVALRAICPSVKVIGSSGLDASSSIARAMAAGLEHYVPKPYTAQAMLTKLAAVLEAP
ncbi:MAG: PAS domain S-box protein [Thermoanaerobaculia bacterium]